MMERRGRAELVRDQGAGFQKGLGARRGGGQGGGFMDMGARETSSGRFSRWRELAGPAAGVMGAQGATILIGAVAGLLVVRALPTEDYARYALALGVLGSMTMLGDAGTTTGAMARGGAVWREPERLGGVLREARAIRTKIAGWTAALGLPALAALLWRLGAGAAETAGWVAVVGGLFLLNLRAGLLEVPLKLHQRLRVTQGVALGQAVMRLGAMAAAVWAWPAGLVAAVAGGWPQAWANRRLARAGAGLVEQRAEAGAEAGDAVVRGELMAVVRRALPGGVYYVVSQQAGLWFLTVGGTSLAVAQLGALGRIALLVGVVNAVAVAVWVPRFARLEAGAGLRRAYGRALAMTSALVLPLVAVVFTCPAAVLWLVGPAYAGLEGQLQLAVVAAVAQVLGAVAMQLTYGRGWLPRPWMGIGAALATQVACVVVDDVTTLEGALRMGLWMGLQSMAVHAGYFWWKTRGGRGA